MYSSKVECIGHACKSEGYRKFRYLVKRLYGYSSISLTVLNLPYTIYVLLIGPLNFG